MGVKNCPSRIVTKVWRLLVLTPLVILTRNIAITTPGSIMEHYEIWTITASAKATKNVEKKPYLFCLLSTVFFMNTKASLSNFFVV